MGTVGEKEKRETLRTTDTEREEDSEKEREKLREVKGRDCNTKVMILEEE